eukprot:Rhum_TRINITY_DN12499_c0_g1::Rhum_TRINITY_DN12499_c0_g1_i2::g.52299::m.52299
MSGTAPCLTIFFLRGDRVNDPVAVEVGVDETVGGLKKAVAREAGLRAASQCLLLNGTDLGDDDVPLSATELCDGSEVSLALSERELARRRLEAAGLCRNHRSALRAAAANDVDTLVDLETAGLTLGRADEGCDSALMLAAQHVKATRYLLTECKSAALVRQGIDTADRKGNTALMHACWNGNLAVVKLLVEAKASVLAENEERDTPLVWAAMNGHVAVLRYLKPLLSGPGIHKLEQKRQVSLALVAAKAFQHYEAVAEALGGVR